jgi:pimeloyl-ACP methyl ester carboxylesterase
VNVVGHSYGGPDAFNATVRAGREGLRVDNLVTVDPVTAFRAAPERGRPAGFWMNVDATPSSRDGSDRLARIPFFAGIPSRLPTDRADRRPAISAHHKDVDTLMVRSGAREVLDASRRPKMDILSDEQPINDWMTYGSRRDDRALAKYMDRDRVECVQLCHGWIGLRICSLVAYQN